MSAWKKNFCDESDEEEEDVVVVFLVMSCVASTLARSFTVNNGPDQVEDDFVNRGAAGSVLIIACNKN